MGYREQNVKAVDVEMTAEHLGTLEQAFPAGIVAGDRYEPAAMRTVGV